MAGSIWDTWRDIERAQRDPVLRQEILDMLGGSLPTNLPPQSVNVVPPKSGWVFNDPDTIPEDVVENFILEAESVLVRLRKIRISTDQNTQVIKGLVKGIGANSSLLDEAKNVIGHYNNQNSKLTNAIITILNSHPLILSYQNGVSKYASKIQKLNIDIHEEARLIQLNLAESVKYEVYIGAPINVTLQPQQTPQPPAQSDVEDQLLEQIRLLKIENQQKEAEIQLLRAQLRAQGGLKCPQCGKGVPVDLGPPAATVNPKLVRYQKMKTTGLEDNIVYMTMKRENVSDADMAIVFGSEEKLKEVVESLAPKDRWIEGYTENQNDIFHKDSPVSLEIKALVSRLRTYSPQPSVLQPTPTPPTPIVDFRSLALNSKESTDMAVLLKGYGMFMKDASGTEIVVKQKLDDLTNAYKKPSVELDDELIKVLEAFSKEKAIEAIMKVRDYYKNNNASPDPQQTIDVVLYEMYNSFPDPTSITSATRLAVDPDVVLDRITELSQDQKKLDVNTQNLIDSDLFKIVVITAKTLAEDKAKKSLEGMGIDAMRVMFQSNDYISLVTKVVESKYVNDPDPNKAAAQRKRLLENTEITIDLTVSIMNTVSTVNYNRTHADIEGILKYIARKFPDNERYADEKIKFDNVVTKLKNTMDSYIVKMAELLGISAKKYPRLVDKLSQIEILLTQTREVMKKIGPGLTI